MLAKRLSTILPPMSLDEALETTKIHSVAGKVKNELGLVTQRPFRKPHHTISENGLVGGGSYPQPGEISLAHNGVLFLDELPEYKRNVLEVMRQPLEDRTVTIARARFSVEYPASFMLVAAMNPCPCGYYNHPQKECVCGPGVVQRYLNKISGPLMDRIDLHVEVTPVSFDELSTDVPNEGSLEIRNRVEGARKIQENRYREKNNVHCNAQMNRSELEKHCLIDEKSQNLIKTAMLKLGLSARAYDRILKVARTIADLDLSKTIEVKHISEAIQYRSLDKGNWGNR
jgi:magnesium chelatase family protein